MNPASAILVQMARDTGAPVVTEFSLFLLARQLFRDRGYRDWPLPPRNRALSGRRARKLLDEATWDPSWPSTFTPPDRLPRDPDFSSTLFTLRKGEADEVMMIADPFCYLSHSSALALHGLSRAAGADLHISTPDRLGWSAYARAYMEATLDFDLAYADEDDLPFRLVRPQPHSAVRGRNLYRHETRRPLDAKSLAHAPMRATPIGVTFRDTLHSSSLCGGIEEVLWIWRHHACNHLDEIITAVDGSSEKIIRVRAGYLLEEALGVSDPRIEAWRADAQRGSSRKLDSAAPYANRFSARWMLSINVSDPDLPSTSAAPAD